MAHGRARSAILTGREPWNRSAKASGDPSPRVKPANEPLPGGSALAGSDAVGVHGHRPAVGIHAAFAINARSERDRGGGQDVPEELSRRAQGGAAADQPGDV